MLRILQLPETLTTINLRLWLRRECEASKPERGCSKPRAALFFRGNGRGLASEPPGRRQAAESQSPHRTGRGPTCYVYPSWQVTDGGTLKGLEEVLTDLKEHDSWMQIQFMLQPNSRLNDRTPLELLRKVTSRVSESRHAHWASTAHHGWQGRVPTRDHQGISLNANCPSAR